MSQSIKSVFPKHRQDAFSVKSWGFKDCYFYYDEERKCLSFHGERYPDFHNKLFKNAEAFLRDMFNLDVKTLRHTNFNSEIPDYDFEHVDCEEFRGAMDTKGIEGSMTIEDRYFRGYSQSAQDIAKACHYRIPDIVLWPKSHEEVEFVVQQANKFDVVIIPYGGGTNVSSSVNCPEYEQRTIVSLDTTQMNRLMWLDEESMLACFEAGVAGQDMENLLESKGFTMGHEPDSIEFSTLGGWIATRSSGIKQHSYGNIEGIVVKTKVVTSVGTLDKPVTPRSSMGPEVENLIFGSEGTLGVITQAVVRIHKTPEVRQHGAFVFPTFQLGIKFMKECATRNCIPASLRLVDNGHVRYAFAVFHYPSWFAELVEKIKQKYVNFVVGDLYCVASYLMEGNMKTVRSMDQELWSIASKYDAIYAGAQAGQRAYFMTLTIGYARDMILRLGDLQDSLETSVTWDKLEACISNMEKCFQDQLVARSVKGSLMYRISQVYHEGVCVYFYFGVRKCENHLETFISVYAEMKDCLVRSGACLSHHHGIGKRGQQKFSQYLPAASRRLLRTIKVDVDPKNVFGAGNLIFNESLEKVEPKL